MPTRAEMRAFLAGLDYATLTQDFHEPGLPSITGCNANIADLMNSDQPFGTNNVCNRLGWLDANSPGFRFSLMVEFLASGVFLGSAVLDLEDGTEVLPYKMTLMNKRQANAGSAPQNQALVAGNATFGRMVRLLGDSNLRVRDLPAGERATEEAKILARGFTNEPTENYRRRVGDLRGRGR